MSTLIGDAGEQQVLGESRLRVLTLLQDAGRPLGVADVAAVTGLHANTARFHLDGLVDAGLVDRATESREQPGRPRALYTARPGSARGGQRSYRLLAEILTDYLASHAARPAKEALEAGLRWGRHLAKTPSGLRRRGRPVDPAGATRQLVAMLDDVGFVPEARTVRRERQILLHHCPFREAAIEHQDVVCAVHLGLMQGMLTELEAPIVADRLDPFVEPSLCVAHLRVKDDAPGSATKRPGQ
ncbi:MAG TPA: helix-turn-helix domain-containing protein [Acidothermaceae bacterium]